MCEGEGVWGGEAEGRRCPYQASLPAEDCNCLLSWSQAERAELNGVDESVKAEVNFG